MNSYFVVDGRSCAFGKHDTASMAARNTARDCSGSQVLTIKRSLSTAYPVHNGESRIVGRWSGMDAEIFPILDKHGRYGTGVLIPDQVGRAVGCGPVFNEYRRLPVAVGSSRRAGPSLYRPFRHLSTVTFLQVFHPKGYC